MIVTVIEARQKWCPMTRVPFNRQITASGEIVAAGPVGNRATPEEAIGLCIGDNCMWWRPYPETQDEGFCGIAYAGYGT